MNTTATDSANTNAGQQADQNTEARTPGTPLTLDAALLRIAELEQNAADAAKAHEDRRFSARLRRVVDDLADSIADEVRACVAERLCDGWERAAQELPPGASREELLEALDRFATADGFASMLISELLPDHLDTFAEEELESAIASAVREKEEEARPRTDRDALKEGGRGVGPLADAAWLGLRIIDAKEDGREIGAGTPEAAEITTEKLRIAEALLQAAKAVDTARPEELPALLASSVFAQKKAA